MAVKETPTTIPRVPIQTPMFEPSTAGDEDQFQGKWKLTRTWIIFFERIFKGNTSAEASSPGPFQRTLLLKDLTPGVSIADHTTIWVAGTGLKVTAVLRKPLASDLTVQLWKLDIDDVGAGFQKIIADMTVPQSHGVNEPLVFSSFVSNALKQMHVKDVIRWDITASDSQTDRAGVAAFTFEWQ